LNAGTTQVTPLMCVAAASAAICWRLQCYSCHGRFGLLSVAYHLHDCVWQAVVRLGRLFVRANLQLREHCHWPGLCDHTRPPTRQPRTHGCSGSATRSLLLAQRRSAPMRAAQVRATLLWALCSVAAAQEGVPRRGPPRGPIKEDKSTFFGKEGDQSHPCGNQPAVRAAAASSRRAVARAVASKASSHTHRTQVAARGEPLHAVRAHRVRAPPRRPRLAPDLRDHGHGQGAGRDEEEAVVMMVSASRGFLNARLADDRRVIRNSRSPFFPSLWLAFG
jgi:hypothetical protein